MRLKGKARWITFAVYVVTSGVLYFAFDAADMTKPLLLATVIALALVLLLDIYFLRKAKRKVE